MIRLAVAAAAFLALFAVVANEANALTSTTRQCISRERRAFRDALRAARAAEQRTFQGKYSDCFGPGAGCAQGCQIEQTNCQLPFKNAQQKCIEDNDAQGRDDPSFTSCGDIFENAIKNDCNLRQNDQDAVQCATDARLARFACTQQCALDQAAGFDTCNFNFGDCVQACASQR